MKNKINCLYQFKLNQTKQKSVFKTKTIKRKISSQKLTSTNDNCKKSSMQFICQHLFFTNYYSRGKPRSSHK